MTLRASCEHNRMEIRILSAADIRRALTARDAVDAMRVAFGELFGGTATVPVRNHLESARGLMLVMPAVLGRRGALGTKVVSVFPDNPSRAAPMVQGAVLLLDAETGRVRALLDGACSASLTEDAHRRRQRARHGTGRGPATPTLWPCSAPGRRDDRTSSCSPGRAGCGKCGSCPGREPARSSCPPDCRKPRTP